MVALRGLSTWRVQARTQYERDLARRTLKAIYRERDALRDFGKEVYVEEEIAAATGRTLAEWEMSEGLELAAGKITRSVYRRRWEAVAAADSALTVELLEVEAAWGELARAEISLIQGVMTSVYAALSEYLYEEDDRPVLGVFRAILRPDDSAAVGLDYAVEQAREVLRAKLVF